MKDSILKKLFTKWHTYIGVALKPKVIVPCCRVLYFFKYVFSAFTLKILILYKKGPKTFSIYIFDLKCCHHPCILF